MILKFYIFLGMTNMRSIHFSIWQFWGFIFFYTLFLLSEHNAEAHIKHGHKRLKYEIKKKNSDSPKCSVSCIFFSAFGSAWCHSEGMWSCQANSSGSDHRCPAHLSFKTSVYKKQQIRRKLTLKRKPRLSLKQITVILN